MIQRMAPIMTNQTEDRSVVMYLCQGESVGVNGFLCVRVCVDQTVALATV